jgi:spermidine synthase
MEGSFSRLASGGRPPYAPPSPTLPSPASGGGSGRGRGEGREGDQVASSTFRGVVYGGAFVTGAIVMSFEMLGSRYLNPYFGSGIYTWASLISTVLAALTAGYFAGGLAADRYPSARVLGAAVLIGSIFIFALPSFSTALLEALLDAIDDIKAGSLVSAFVLMFFPVAFYGAYSPFAIRLLLRSTRASGGVSGGVYAISTAGSIVGTLGTTFLLIPAIGTRAITFILGAAGVACGVALIAYPARRRRASVAVLVGTSLAGAFAATATAPSAARSAEIFDRAAVLAREDGQLAHIEGQYNDIYVVKRGNELLMTARLKGWNYTESRIDLANPDVIPARYLRLMTTALAYAPQVESVFLMGLGGGVLTNYLGRFLPDARIDSVEIDPGVIATAKTWFGVKEIERMRIVASDGRVFLNRNRSLYDVALIDAYIGGSVPFHLMTKEFYTLLKRRLVPGGAAVFNIHEPNRLFPVSVRTLQSVFATVDVYYSGFGEVAVVATDAPPATAAAERRAAELQKKYGFRHALPELLAQRSELDPGGGEVLTDDFAPVDVYVADGPQWKKGDDR